MSNTLKRTVPATLSLAVLVVPVFVWLNKQAILDWWQLRDYAPPVQIAKIAEEDTMTNKARHLFYVNHPQLIDSKVQFRNACPQSEQTIVLGCYHSGSGGIAILDVTDPRLRGVEEVTSAHEMLHAAYERLGTDERQEINKMLNDFYQNSVKDKRIISTINAYKKSEPNDVVNEMHSIFGTEIKNLPEPLENYYQEYFTNRQRVVGFSEQYQAVFVKNDQKLKGLKTQIENLKQQLAADKDQIQNKQESLAVENNRMQNLLASNRTQEYNSAVPGYNAQVQNLRNLISIYNNEVQQINDLVEQYNELAYTQEDLLNSIDTRLNTQSAQ